MVSELVGRPRAQVRTTLWFRPVHIRSLKELRPVIGVIAAGCLIASRAGAFFHIKVILQRKAFPCAKKRVPAWYSKQGRPCPILAAVSCDGYGDAQSSIAGASPARPF